MWLINRIIDRTPFIVTNTRESTKGTEIPIPETSLNIKDLPSLRLLKVWHTLRDILAPFIVLVLESGKT
jgi:hypothetical protein